MGITSSSSSTSAVNNLRRSRGYNFENSLVTAFNTDSWQARRLGGSSVGLPDIVVTNNAKSLVMSVECKSTVGNYCYVPNDQLVRCNTVLNMFNIYENQKILFAFKFSRKGKTKTRPITKYYFFIMPYFRIDLTPIDFIRCDRVDGCLSLHTASCFKDEDVKAFLKSGYRCESLLELKEKLVGNALLSI